MLLEAPDESLWVGVLRLALYVAGSQGLKDKRRVVASVRNRLKARHKVAVAEVGHLDDHVRAVLAVAVVGNDPRHLRSVLDGLRRDVEEFAAAEVEAADVAILRPWDGGGPGRYDDAHG